MDLNTLRQRLALTEPTPAGQDEALRFVTGPEAGDDLVVALAPELFEWSLGDNYRCERVRLAFLRLDSETFRRVLGPLIDGFLVDDQRDGWDYAGLVSLLMRRAETDLFENVLNAAERSTDEQIREVAARHRHRLGDTGQ